MSLTRKENSTSGHDYRSPFNRFRITSMKPVGKIFPGLVEEIKKIRWSDGSLREIKTGKMVPGLRVQMRGEKTSRSLAEVCERAAEKIDADLRERGYLPKMPQKTEAIQGGR